MLHRSFFEAASRPEQPRGSRRRSLLFVFTSEWAAPDRVLVRALRAELPRLQLALVVFSRDDLSYIDADSAEASRSAPTTLEHELAARRHDGALLGRRADAVFSLVEPNGRERFRLSRRVRGDVWEALREALALAAESVSLDASVGSGYAKDVLLYSLVGALSLVLSEELAGTEQTAPSLQA